MHMLFHARVWALGLQATTRACQHQYRSPSPPRLPLVLVLVLVQHVQYLVELLRKVLPEDGQELGAADSEEGAVAGGRGHLQG